MIMHKKKYKNIIKNILNSIGILFVMDYFMLSPTVCMGSDDLRNDEFRPDIFYRLKNIENNSVMTLKPRGQQGEIYEVKFQQDDGKFNKYNLFNIERIELGSNIVFSIKHNEKYLCYNTCDLESNNGCDLELKGDNLNSLKIKRKCRDGSYHIDIDDGVTMEMNCYRAHKRILEGNPMNFREKPDGWYIKHRTFEISPYRPNEPEDKLNLGNLYFEKRNFQKSYEIFQELDTSKHKFPHIAQYISENISRIMNDVLYINYKISKIQENKLYITSPYFYMHVTNGNDEFVINKGEEFNIQQARNDLIIKFGSANVVYGYNDNNNLTLLEIVKRISKNNPFAILNSSNSNFIGNCFVVKFDNHMVDSYKITIDDINVNMANIGSMVYALDLVWENRMPATVDSFSNIANTLYNAAIKIAEEGVEVNHTLLSFGRKDKK